MPDPDVGRPLVAERKRRLDYQPEKDASKGESLRKPAGNVKCKALAPLSEGIEQAFPNHQP